MWPQSHPVLLALYLSISLEISVCLSVCQSFNVSSHFILVRVTVDLEPILGKLVVRWKWDPFLSYLSNKGHHVPNLSGSMDNMQNSAQAVVHIYWLTYLFVSFSCCVLHANQPKGWFCLLKQFLICRPLLKTLWPSLWGKFATSWSKLSITFPVECECDCMQAPYP